jgi:hypothetical protein
MLPQRRQPTLSRPAAGVCRVDDDHMEAGVDGHLREPAPEPAGGDAGDEVSEPAAAPAARGPVSCSFASLGSGFGEVEVLDDHGAGVVVPCRGDELGYRGADLAVALGGGQPGQLQGDGERRARDVAVGGDDGGGKVAGVHVNRHDR